MAEEIWKEPPTLEAIENFLGNFYTGPKVGLSPTEKILDRETFPGRAFRDTFARQRKWHAQKYQKLKIGRTIRQRLRTAKQELETVRQKLETVRQEVRARMPYEERQALLGMQLAPLKFPGFEEQFAEQFEKLRREYRRVYNLIKVMKAIKELEVPGTKRPILSISVASGYSPPGEYTAEYPLMNLEEFSPEELMAAWKLCRQESDNSVLTIVKYPDFLPWKTEIKAAEEWKEAQKKIQDAWVQIEKAYKEWKLKRQEGNKLAEMTYPVFPAWEAGAEAAAIWEAAQKKIKEEWGNAEKAYKTWEEAQNKGPGPELPKRLDLQERPVNISPKEKETIKKLLGACFKYHAGNMKKAKNGVRQCLREFVIGDISSFLRIIEENLKVPSSISAFFNIDLKAPLQMQDPENPSIVLDLDNAKDEAIKMAKSAKTESNMAKADFFSQRANDIETIAHTIEAGGSFSEISRRVEYQGHISQILSDYWELASEEGAVRRCLRIENSLHVLSRLGLRMNRLPVTLDSMGFNPVYYDKIREREGLGVLQIEVTDQPILEDFAAGLEQAFESTFSRAGSQPEGDPDATLDKAFAAFDGAEAKMNVASDAEASPIPPRPPAP